MQAGLRESIRPCQLGFSPLFTEEVWVLGKMEEVDLFLCFFSSILHFGQW